ncbi:neoverrucotoxin subunit beta-like [Brachyhypopomus gauderio]|uniref:neoverrucotoxin subunit beta-like n=1 Tax=Brachyhypopomus gauderio TaxID=698409 RepID=UPI004041D328
MAATGEDMLEIATLGRPFQLGMLYDIRKDALVPGITLWKHEQLKHNTDVCPQHNTEFKVSTEDSIDEKFYNLKVDGNLKLSILGGLVNLNGASKYFADTKKSFRQERLTQLLPADATLHYGSNTKFTQLTMDHLGSVAHPDVFVNNIATHVVLYGANAYFVFDRQVSADEKKKDVNREVDLAVAKLKGVSVGSQGTLAMAQNEMAAFEKFNCTFYGDFKLPSNPNTFEDAMKVYTDLPNMLGVNGEHAVPLKVWLYPLVKLDSRASRLERNISTEIIRAVESVIETSNAIEMKCDDLLQDTVAKSFKAFEDKVLDFKKYCCNYKVDFMTKLGLLLPNVRGGKTDISAVTDLLRGYEESPFNIRDLQQWIKDKENESTTIKALLNQLNEEYIDGDIDSLLMDLEVENLVCYTFTSLQEADILLTKQEKYLRPTAKKEIDNPSQPGPKQKSWLSSDITKIMKNNLCVFKVLKKKHECDQSNQKTIFTVISKPVDNHTGSFILLYENGSDEPVCFHPPSKPDCPVVDHMTDNNVTIKLGPSCPLTVETRLLYKTQQQNHWNVKHLEKNQDSVTLTDLDYSTIYEIKCVAVGKLSYTIESDVICLRVIDKDLLRNTQKVI